MEHEAGRKALLAVEQVVFLILLPSVGDQSFLEDYGAEEILRIGLGGHAVGNILQEVINLVGAPDVWALVLGDAIPPLKSVLDENLVTLNAVITHRWIVVALVWLWCWRVY